jgi:hypothetical protein
MYLKQRGTNLNDITAIYLVKHSGEAYSIQHSVIKFVSYLRQVGGFLPALQFQLQSGYLVTSASRHLTKDYIYTRAQQSLKV